MDVTNLVSHFDAIGGVDGKESWCSGVSKVESRPRCLHSMVRLHFEYAEAELAIVHKLFGSRNKDDGRMKFGGLFRGVRWSNAG